MKLQIPFYFGNDARRMQVLYKGEGCLIFTAGGVMGARVVTCLAFTTIRRVRAISPEPRTPAIR